jgi:hypothetical protein
VGDVRVDLEMRQSSKRYLGVFEPITTPTCYEIEISPLHFWEQYVATAYGFPRSLPSHSGTHKA